MIYGTHQANAYENERDLDESILDRAPGYLKCSWKGGSIASVTKNMVNDLSMSGRFEIVEVFQERGQVRIEDTASGIEYTVSANGYVS